MRRVIDRLQNTRIRSRLFVIVVLFFFTMVTLFTLLSNGFDTLVRRREETSFTNLVKQISNHVTTITNNVMSIARVQCYSKLFQEYVLDDDAMKRYTLHPYITDMLTNLVASNSYMYNINLFFPDMKGTINSNYNDGYNFAVYKQITDDILLHQPTKGYFTLNTNIYGACFAYIEPIFSTAIQHFPSEPYGYYINLCNGKVFHQIIESLDIPESALLLMADTNGIIWQGKDKSMVGKYLLDGELSDVLLAAESEYQSIIYQGQKTFFASVVEPNTGWRIIFLVPAWSMASDVVQLRSVAMGVCVALTALIATISLSIVFSIMYQTNEFVSKMEDIPQHNTSFRFDCCGPAELATIKISVNHMLERIERASEHELAAHQQLYQAKLAQKQAELYALQSQINPHFLYNTLECIRSIGLQYHSTEIVSISTCMANIFRYCIKGKEIVTLQEELKCARDYFSIISIRYMERYSLRINVDESLQHIPFIKMVLQPIVENAVYHGLEKCLRPGIVELSMQLCNHTLILTAKDNGAGMQTEEAEQITKVLNHLDTTVQENNSTRCVALQNIMHRLRLQYSAAASIDIQSSPDEGTTVTIRMPDYAAIRIAEIIP